jgi:SurA N-terminal domain
LPPAAPAPPASSPPAPDQTLVCVAAQAITGQTYSHWLTVASKDAGSPGKGHPAPSATALRNEVLGFLISSDWVKGEAADLGVRLSAGEVRKNFDHIRNQQFPKRKEFEQFLRQTGQTVADLLFRVELNLLSERVQKRVVAGHHSASSKQRALSRFVTGFKAKWQAQTYCAAQYAVSDCGHVQESV